MTANVAWYIFRSDAIVHSVRHEGFQQGISRIHSSAFLQPCTDHERLITGLTIAWTKDFQERSWYTHHFKSKSRSPIDQEATRAVESIVAIPASRRAGEEWEGCQ